MATIFIPRERSAGERRVATVPAAVTKLARTGLEVVVEPGAGAAAGLEDGAYVDAGARLAEGEDLAQAAVVARVAPPTLEEVRALAPGTVLLTFVAPHRNLEVVGALAEARITTIAMELVPRISRAQPMDALSSQANISGYRAVVTAAYELDKYFPLFMTAAGTIKPATPAPSTTTVAGRIVPAAVMNSGKYLSSS